MVFRKIAQGAEAVITADSKIVSKQRVQKRYRHPMLDILLRRQRSRHEARMMQRLHDMGFPVPEILSVDEKESAISMEFVKGKLVKDLLATNPSGLSREIGKNVAALHSADIIHGDLTTSNMIRSVKDGRVHFIDYGLSFISLKEEDKAVDLFMLRKGLEAKHYDIADDCFRAVVESYKKNYLRSSAVLERLAKVEKRGRHKKRAGDVLNP